MYPCEAGLDQGLTAPVTRIQGAPVGRMAKTEELTSALLPPGCRDPHRALQLRRGLSRGRGGRNSSAEPRPAPSCRLQHPTLRPWSLCQGSRSGPMWLDTADSVETM